LLSADRLPDVLTVTDILSGEEDIALLVDDLFRDGWSLSIDLYAVEPEHGEGCEHDGRECDPKFKIAHSQGSLRIQNPHEPAWHARTDKTGSICPLDAPTIRRL